MRHFGEDWTECGEGGTECGEAWAGLRGGVGWGLGRRGLG